MQTLFRPEKQLEVQLDNKVLVVRVAARCVLRCDLKHACCIVDVSVSLHSTIIKIARSKTLHHISH